MSVKGKPRRIRTMTAGLPAEEFLRLGPRSPIGPRSKEAERPSFDHEKHNNDAFKV